MSELEAPRTHSSESRSQPYLNVTPLIDVLLVMLIIFMAIAPLKAARFMTRVPARPDAQPVEAPFFGLVVTIKSDRTLMLNRETDLGTVIDPSKLSERLAAVFQERLINHAYAYELRDRIDLRDDERIQRTVFIKAPRTIPYGEVVRVLDAVKGAGAQPVGLQLDDLD